MYSQGAGLGSMDGKSLRENFRGVEILAKWTLQDSC